jgi:hypothetical protein
MIDVKHLRVGNIIKSKDGNLPYWAITEEDMITILQAEDRSIYEPISITEEWLLKLGFEQCGYEMLSWKHETLLTSFNLDGINWADFDEPDYQFLNYKVADEILRIDYVHQLQNLYWCLCNEELVLNNN